MTRRLLVLVLVVAAVTSVAGCGASGEDTDTATSESTEGMTETTGGGEETSTTTTAAPEMKVFEVTATDGAVEGGVQEWTVTEGETVTIRATSDEDEQIHVHGFDLALDLAAGTPGTLSFDANLTGVFEVEMHHSGKAADLRVNPA